jgi:hypothetical protein
MGYVVKTASLYVVRERSRVVRYLELDRADQGLRTPEINELIM